jgi:hypothetical protein
MPKPMTRKRKCYEAHRWNLAVFYRYRSSLQLAPYRLQANALSEIRRCRTLSNLEAELLGGSPPHLQEEEADDRGEHVPVNDRRYAFAAMS